MKKSAKIIISLIVISLITIGMVSDRYFKVQKSFEIFSSVFKIISEVYVLDIDPEILLKNGINGMLSSLDPYTVYYDDANNDNLELITDGSYVGFGFSVQIIDSMPYVFDVSKGNPAYNQGLKIGDVIYSIDSVVVINDEDGSLRDLTKGEINTYSTFKVLRNNLIDTVVLELERDIIYLEEIPTATVIDNNIAYIKLDRFSKQSASKFRKKLRELIKDNELTGLVIDLRNNPGGLLQSAVAICEMFVPKGSMIVKTKGNNGENFSYESISEPEYPELPLAVIINEGSASASEILAGALQDLDRAVIIGKRSFGKGLVQTVHEIPYGRNLKITSAKYYIPSGRCIQRLGIAEQYDDLRISVQPDTNMFFTKAGRPVKELQGIEPDEEIDEFDYNESYKDIRRSYSIFKYVNSYKDSILINHDSTFVVNDFINYLEKSELEGTFFTQLSTKQINSIASERSYSDKISKEIESLNKIIIENEIIQATRDNKFLYRDIMYEYLRRQNIDSSIKFRMKHDPNLIYAKEIFDKKKYSEILSGVNIDESKN